jgi:transposase InsO family protein
MLFGQDDTSIVQGWAMRKPVVQETGALQTLHDDHGELRFCLASRLDAWAHEHGVKLPFIRPGKPVENAHIERFNGRLLEVCLNQPAFVSLDDARKRIEVWRTHYNLVRPIVPWDNWRWTHSGNCIHRKPASPLNYEWCTRRDKVRVMQ